MSPDEITPGLTAAHSWKSANSQALRKGFAAIVASFALLAGCVVSAGSAPEVTLESAFQLKAGEFARIAETNLLIGFQGVTSDSRCPRGETCFWEGDATVRIWLQEADGAKDEFELHTSSKGQHSASYKGFTLRLVAVDPAPVSGVEINPANYVTTFQITSEDSGGDDIL